MKELAIHKIHRTLAEAAYMHMNHTTGRIKVENIPARLLELLLMQNYMLIRHYDELHELSMVAYTAGDMEWLHNICEAIEFLKDETLTKKGEWK